MMLSSRPHSTTDMRQGVCLLTLLLAVWIWTVLLHISYLTINVRLSINLLLTYGAHWNSQEIQFLNRSSAKANHLPEVAILILPSCRCLIRRNWNHTNIPSHWKVACRVGKKQLFSVRLLAAKRGNERLFAPLRLGAHGWWAKAVKGDLLQRVLPASHIGTLKFSKEGTIWSINQFIKNS